MAERLEAPMPCTSRRYGGASLRSRRHALAAEDGAAREEPLAPGPDVLVVVHELEGALAEFEHRDVGRRADVERAAVPEHLEQARDVDGGVRDQLIERHAEIQELRQDVR